MKESTLTLLKEHGIKPSSQRVKIYDYLSRHEGHPTVDDIYLELHKEGHLFSRATVYNTVNLFLDKGLIRKVRVEAHEMRFDAIEGFHAHFKCDACGAIYDLAMEEPKPPYNHGHQLGETSLVYRGLCRSCLVKEGAG